MAEREESRRRQVDTITRRYGPKYYEEIAKRRVPNPLLGKWASWRRWHPTRFDTDGSLLPEWENVFHDTSNQGK